MVTLRKKQLAALKNMHRTCDVGLAMLALNMNARKLADTALSLQAGLADTLLGGMARFTGHNRVYANGAVAYEVKCRKCQQPFWVTAVPYAYCPDCDPLLFSR
jgi:hypothetical protein